MSISPPPFSPARHSSTEENVNEDYVDDDEDFLDSSSSARSIISSFDLYKNAIDQLRSCVTNSSIEQQQNALDYFKPLSTCTNAWLYMRTHDDLFNVLRDFLLVENLSIRSTTLSIFANIACEQASHEQILETDLIDIVCREVIDIGQVDITNRCFRLLGNICTVEDAARKMIDADLARSMGNVLRSCTDAACLHSTIRCSRKLSTFAFCRDRMLDSMCLLSICKQLFANKVDLRKEAMKAVLEWGIDSCDRSRSQLREGEIFRFLITTIEAKSDKEYRHIAFRLLNHLLHYADMRTEFGLRDGLDFLVKMIEEHRHQSTYEHLKFIGLFCVCCQECTNRRLIKDDPNKMQLFFNFLEKFQYRTSLLDLLLTAIGQFIYDEQSLGIFIKQMQFIERMCDLLEAIVLVKYDNIEPQIKRMKTHHTTDNQQQRLPVIVDFNESLFTEFVEKTHLDDERQTSSTSAFRTVTNSNIETRRRTEALIFTLLSKLSYETTEKTLRRALYNRRLVSLLLRYIRSADEPNPRAVRILYRLTKMIDCGDDLLDLALPYSIVQHFYRTQFNQQSNSITNNDDQYLLNILLNDNRAFFQRLSWSNDQNRLFTIESMLLKNIEHYLNLPFAINELLRRLNNNNTTDDKFQIMLTLVATLKEQHFQSILFDDSPGYAYLMNLSHKRACFWALRSLVHRILQVNDKNYLDDFLAQLQTHSISSSLPTTARVEDVQLKIATEHYVPVDSRVLSTHSEYFKTLFSGSFRERNQPIVTFHLPSDVSNESFIHFINLLMNDNEQLQLNFSQELFRLCDHYLLDYLPYRIAHDIFREFTNNPNVALVLNDLTSIVSKPTLISCLIQACFCHLFTSNTHISVEAFEKLAAKYPNELRTLILAFVQHTCWFANDLSPFSS